MVVGSKAEEGGKAQADKAKARRHGIIKVFRGNTETSQNYLGAVRKIKQPKRLSQTG